METLQTQGTVTVSLSPRQARSAFLGVSPFASTDTCRHIICGIYLHLQGDTLELVATDGRTMAAFELPLGYKVEKEIHAIIPAAAVKLLLSPKGLLSKKAVKAAKGLLTVTGEAKETSGGLLSFSLDGQNFSLRTAEGNYPKWRQVVPKHDQTLNLGGWRELQSYSTRQTEVLDAAGAVALETARIALQGLATCDADRMEKESQITKAIKRKLRDLKGTERQPVCFTQLGTLAPEFAQPTVTVSGNALDPVFTVERAKYAEPYGFNSLYLDRVAEACPHLEEATGSTFGFSGMKEKNSPLTLSAVSYGNFARASVVIMPCRVS
jgi:hypothetical protein